MSKTTAKPPYSKDGKLQLCTGCNKYCSRHLNMCPHCYPAQRAAVTFGDLPGGTFFRVKGHESRGVSLKFVNRLDVGTYINAINTEGGRFEYVDARVEVQPVTMTEQSH